jgi:maltose alpha-D-glucosyltransferase/alpha-amylase
VDDDRNAESTAIATVHEFAPGHTTAWDGLVRLLTAGDGLSGAYGSDVFAVVASLGRVTARMHRAFSARPDLPAFAPDIATSSGLQAAAARMREHAERVFALIESRLPQCEPAVALRLAAVLRARSKLVTHFECLPGIARATSTIRVHGDYHLGQVLVAEHDSKLLVIDFEGEPRRTLAERREKTWAAKDVAGMCRSFDYLLRHVAKSTGRAYAAADLEQLETRFLDTYRDEAAGAWWPTDPAAADMLLTVFKLDKAIYELAYELNNRPDWIDVPLAAIEEAVATAARSRG